MAELFPDILTPTTVTERIKRLLDKEFGRAAVAGEIAGLSRPPSGHVYFTLKDSANTLGAVVWKSSRRGGLDSLLENGLEVLAWGKITCYGPRSSYQLICDRLQPRGEGALKRAYELLKKRLEAEGLFREDRKRPLPEFPRRVALLTARQGAALEDFARTAVLRYPGATISLLPVRVQGDGAASDMAEAIASLNAWGGFDVIVLTRGGGSAEDLWAFNEEPLVRAVAASRIPVLAAVGHTRDVSLCEMAADRRAITPTAAAEAVFPDARAAAAEALGMAARMRRAVESQLERNRTGLETLARRAGTSFGRRLDSGRQSLARLREALAGAMRLEARNASLEMARLGSSLRGAMTLAARSASAELARLAGQLRILSPERRISAFRDELDTRDAALAAIRGRLLNPHRTELDRARERLELLSPLAVLARGYSIAIDARGRLIRRSADVEPGDPFSLWLGEGRLAAEVKSTEDGPQAPPPSPAPEVG
ncbi:MAG: exodeoxyribonuclease VII large subunit [Deltaproteobacteria bacterium]|jgi:exodeoxyribonuclease VII large subunit|nr:exodeoxyribonuclease VII large subunit [Deltaproteobacteria bacterium]